MATLSFLSISLASPLLKLATNDVVHGQRGGVNGDLGQVLLFLFYDGIQTKCLYTRLNGLYQFSRQRPLHSGPVSQFVNQRLAILAQQIGSRTHALLALAGLKDVLQIGIQRQVAGRWLTGQHCLVKIFHRGLHFVHRDVFASASPNGVSVAELLSDAIHVVELLQGGPALVSLAPTRTGSKPDSESFGEIFIRMLLGVPAFYMTNEIAGKSDGPVVVAITAAIGTKDRPPFRSLIEAVGIVERVAGLMAQVHHDLA